MNRLLLAALWVLTVGCSSEVSGPAELVTGRELCANCRMAIVSKYTTAQIVAPGEEPVFFDEIGCLRAHVARMTLPPGAVLYVADHRTGAWLEARRALFTQTRSATPMASGLIAHGDAASRERDPAARGGTPVAVAAILGGGSGGTP